MRGDLETRIGISMIIRGVRKEKNMTGKELILYILQNNLEDRPVFQNGRFLDYLTVSEAAEKFDVGTATIRVWLELNTIEGVKIGDQVFISATTKPSKDLDHNISQDVLEIFIKNHSRKE